MKHGASTETPFTKIAVKATRMVKSFVGTLYNPPLPFGVIGQDKVGQSNIA